MAVYSYMAEPINEYIVQQLNELLALVSIVDKNQRVICYVTGESKDIASISSFVERFKKRGLEIVYMAEPINEYLVK